MIESALAFFFLISLKKGKKEDRMQGSFTFIYYGGAYGGLTP